MKKLTILLSAASLMLAAASCVKETDTETVLDITCRYELSFEAPTKTGISGSGASRSVSWNEGDIIRYYTESNQSSPVEATVSLSGDKAFVTIPRGRTDEFINAVYGAAQLQSSSSTDNCMFVSSPVKSKQRYTTFAQAHLCAAFSDDLENPSLRFHNTACIVHFTSAADVHKVVFSGNNGEIINAGSSGDLKITYSGTALTVEPTASDASNQTSVTIETDGEELDFYFAILPVCFDAGITVKCYDSYGALMLTKKTGHALNTVNASGAIKILNLGKAQDWIDTAPPEPIDLGLSVKWASYNVGASKPEEYGNYYAWGEIAPKNEYKWANYLYSSSKNGPFSKYVLDAEHGTIDHKLILDLDDDAAYANWGDNWRLPLKEEVEELMTRCTWTWTTRNGVNGYNVSGNGQFIFLPANGMRSSNLADAGTVGNYWSSSSSASGTYFAISPYFGQSYKKSDNCYRYFGLGVRPVYGAMVPATEIMLPSTLILTKGIKESETLSATVLPDNATCKNLSWGSSNPSVATVTADGKVTAVALGTATVTVYSADGTKSADCEVFVNQPIESITLDQTALDLYVGDDPIALSATVLPEEHTDKVVIWTSSNLSVARIDEQGRVTGVGAGTATITATARDGSGKKATCTVRVYASHITSISLNYTKRALMKGNTTTLSVTIKPSTANKSVRWTSSDESVATVNQSGQVTGVNIGDADITVTSVDGSMSATCAVTVYQYIESITLDKTSIEMFVGDDPVTLHAEVLPNEYTKPLKWVTSSSRVAKVDSDGVVTAVSNGTATITASAQDGSGIKATCTIKVYQHVESVSFEEPELTMFINRTATLNVTVLPDTAKQSVIWSGSDESVATVDENGKVHSISEGVVTITATSVDGGYTAHCTVNVVPIPKPEAIDLGLSVKWASFNVGASRPEEYGEYFAWGETEPKDYYGFRTYIFNSTGNDSFSGVQLTKYCTFSDWGTVDNKTSLDTEDDAAYVNLGGSWHMPSKNDWEELKTNCDWVWSSEKNGFIVTSKNNNNSIFLPVCGEIWGGSLSSQESGSYWTSEVASEVYGNIRAYYFSMHVLSDSEWHNDISDHDRCYGRSVRAVLND